MRIQNFFCKMLSLTALAGLFACQGQIGGGELPDDSFIGNPSLVAGAVRVVTWNIESVGTRGSTQYNQALSVLQRLNADVVAFNEIDGADDVQPFQDLAADAGYPFIALPSFNPFGPDRNGFFSRLPIVSQVFHTSASISGDSSADDISRLIVEITVDVPGTSTDLTLLVEHWKSGFDNDDEFRRTLESFRIAKALSNRSVTSDAYVVMGDMNSDIDDSLEFPNIFTFAPSGLPFSFEIGNDIEAEMDGPGLVNDPFFYLENPQGPRMVALDARQLDGSKATRPVSGRHIDYILVSPALAEFSPRSEVYDSQDEGLSGGLPKFGAVPSFNASNEAADHLPVFVDLVIPGTEPVEALLEMSFKNPTSVPGIGTAQNEDIVLFDPNDNSWTLIFDGSDVGLGSVAIDGFAELSSGDMLMSFDQPVSIPGLQGGPSGGITIDDSDIVLFRPTQLGSNTQGTFTFFFDGSDVGLTTSSEDIDAIGLDSQERIIISTLGSYSASGISGSDEDLLLFDQSTLGAGTSGNFLLVLDGSDLGMTGSGEDTDAFSLLPTGEFLLSTTGSFAVSGVSGGDELIFSFSPSSLGSTTAGSFASFFNVISEGISSATDIGSLHAIQ